MSRLMFYLVPIDSSLVTLMRAERGEVVRPEPFQQIELAIGTLFGDDPPDR